VLGLLDQRVPRSSSCGSSTGHRASRSSGRTRRSTDGLRAVLGRASR